MNALAMWTPAFIIGYLLTLAVSITGSVMVGLAVYNDAKSKMSLNAVMWAMLVGILGWIPGIVYLCVRNKPLERIYACYSCGWGNPLSARQCRRCGAGLYYPTEETARLQKKAKAFLIIGLVLWGLAAIGEIFMIAHMIQTVMAPILEGLISVLGVIHLTFPFVRKNGFRGRRAAP